MPTTAQTLACQGSCFSPTRTCSVGADSGVDEAVRSGPHVNTTLSQFVISHPADLCQTTGNVPLPHLVWVHRRWTRQSCMQCLATRYRSSIPHTKPRARAIDGPEQAKEKKLRGSDPSALLPRMVALTLVHKTLREPQPREEVQ